MASKFLKVNVTKTSIKRGIRNHGSFCPIARALKKLGLKKVSVYGCGTEFNYKGEYYDIDLPIKAVNFIDNFDERKPVKPFTFLLKVV